MKKNLLKEAINNLGIEDGDIIEFENEFFAYDEKHILFVNTDRILRDLDSADVEAILSGSKDFKLYKKESHKRDLIKENIKTLAEVTFKNKLMIDELVEYKRYNEAQMKKFDKWILWGSIGVVSIIIIALIVKALI